MTNSRLIDAAKAKLPGVSVRPHHIASAVRCGLIRPYRHADGEFSYADQDVEALVDYMTHRSRSARREMEVAST